MNRKETLEAPPSLCLYLFKGEESETDILSGISLRKGDPSIILASNCLSISSRVPLKHRCEEKMHNPVSKILPWAPKVVEILNGFAAQVTSQCFQGLWGGAGPAVRGLHLTFVRNYRNSEFAPRSWARAGTDLGCSQHTHDFLGGAWVFRALSSHVKFPCHSLTQADSYFQSF